ASVTLRVAETVMRATAEGAGPVNALDRAVRQTLVPHYPQLADVRLVDYKVRIVDDHLGTAAKPRVLLESARRDERWSTVGSSPLRNSSRTLVPESVTRASPSWGHVFGEAIAPQRRQ